MIILIAFAFLAGVVTVLSPCILPVLPVVLSGTVGGGKARPLGIITGFVVSFTVFTLTLSALVSLLGISADVLRYIAAGLILAFGLVMVIPPLKNAFMRLVSGLSGAGTRQPAAGGKKGYLSGLVLGLSLGLVWTPCVGPIMASVITLALSTSVDAGAVFITLAYAAGTAVPLFLIMQGGRALLNKFSFFTKHSDKIQKVFGALMILTAVALFTGVDRYFQSFILQALPGYGSGLTALENQDIVLKEISKREGSAQEVKKSALLEAIRQGGNWINSKALTPEDLQGKVVLIDFWTYSCVNCIRTFPYLKAWDDRYRDKGLVIIGVHSPEFAFEKDLGNVQRAVEQFGLRYPVVQDNEFKIWRAFNNHYWPAHYLFDRNGELRYTHFGEGEYEKAEGVIQLLVGEKGSPLAADEVAPTRVTTTGLTPETYLGTKRGQRFISPEGAASGAAVTYTLPRSLERDQWGLTGEWAREEQAARALGPGVITLAFFAQDVYLVLGPAEGEPPARLIVSVDGRVTETEDVQDGAVTVNAYRLYHLFKGDHPQSGVIRIETNGPVKAYAFTFG